jgi:hypothetical protein
MSYNITNVSTSQVTVDQYGLPPGGSQVVPAITKNMVLAENQGLLNVTVINDGTAPQIANPNGDPLVVPQQTLAGATGNVNLTDGATITFDASNGSGFNVVLSLATSLIANPTGLTAGQKIELILKQDATGGRLVTWGSKWKFPGGTKPTLTAGANGVDKISAFFDGTNLLASAQLAFA